MRTNESTTDRVIRVIVGIALLFAAFYVDSAIVGAIFGILAAFAVFTAAVGFGPLYHLFGISTESPRDTKDVPSNNPRPPETQK